MTGGADQGLPLLLLWLTGAVVGLILLGSSCNHLRMLQK